MNNFGDLLGPMLVERILDEASLSRHAGTGRLLTVGSILHLALPGDVVWGSGVNGKAKDLSEVSGLDVRAVRGPLTRQVLQAHGFDAPEIYGDPALLWSRFWPREFYEKSRQGGRREVVIVPNFHDRKRFAGDHRAVNPCAPVHEVIGQIASSDFVIASSLHGVILAEAMGIETRFVTSSTEPPFKYEDYLLGTGRTDLDLATSVEQALALGGQPAPEWDPHPLLDAFPGELWANHV